MIDSLEYAIKKEEEIPRLLNILLDKFFKTDEIPSFNKNMRSAKDILRDYGITEV